MIRIELQDPHPFSWMWTLNNPAKKQVTKREMMGKLKNWKRRSYKDAFLNGGHFVPSGYGSCDPNYSPSQFFTAVPASLVPAITLNTGPLTCVVDAIWNHASE
ncbi:unnamed protein product [Sphenostylis stenocarpa]|uniref:Uncharacterized protein n=1 Tax=Sphenostylis stenocarpa TaxID=92480 RepID=A0AA86T0X8_9FABA|nr:unnamed protein product [Sphenostylis stenocarpa]